MDEGMKLDPAFYALFKEAAIEHSQKARGVAESLHDFLVFYPDKELQRRGMWVVDRLNSIAASSD